MKDYMERRLLGAHEAGSQSNMKLKLTGFCTALTAITVLPALHLGFIHYIWTPNKPGVDREKCSCSCFDTVFRGRYEWPPSTYKHVYFNSTLSSWKIWTIVVIGILAFYECLRYLASLIVRGKLRTTMFALFLSSIYPHYYGWWNFFNYYNEDFFPQFWHQFFFSFTEVLSTAMVVHLCNQDHRPESWKLLVIFSINTMHVIVSALDQFIVNIIHGQGQTFEAVRDLGLMLPDVFHLLVCYFEIGALARRHRTSIFNLFYKEEIMASVLVVTLFSILGKNI